MVNLPGIRPRTLLVMVCRRLEHHDPRTEKTVLPVATQAYQRYAIQMKKPNGVGGAPGLV